MTLEKDLHDALTELIGLGIGKAADVLNSMLDSHIILSIPSVRLVAADELILILSRDAGRNLSAVQMRYTGSMQGAVELIFSSGEAGKLVDCIIGEETVMEEGLDSIRAGTLCEVGNIVINALMGTLSNVLSLDFTYTVPAFIEGDAVRLVADVGVPENSVVLLAETEFLVESKSIRGSIAVFFSMASFRLLEEKVHRYSGGAL
ncbi:MAG: hypothetical protein WCT14_07115 [Treponemataceae bacterium]